VESLLGENEALRRQRNQLSRNSCAFERRRSRCESAAVHSAIESEQRSLKQHAEAISNSIAHRTTADGTETDSTELDQWSTRFPRVERAWLAGELVGDKAEEAAFLTFHVRSTGWLIQAYSSE
jgi:cell division septum initiation protein DivIVA